MTRIQILAVAAAVLFDMPTSKAQDLAALQSDLTVIQSEIKAAQTEDARYAGGLVKTLITARILILSQTEAMLKQKLLSLKLGAPVRYAVDGKGFTLPASANQMLADVEGEISATEGKMRQQEAEVARYSGGLVPRRKRHNFNNDGETSCKSCLAAMNMWPVPW